MSLDTEPEMARKADHDADDRDRWIRIQVDEVEGLRDSVLGADHDVVQLSPAPLLSTLAFAHVEDATYSLGVLGARVVIRGPHSPDKVTLGLGLTIPRGCRHWLKERSTGDSCLFRPGDEQDALYPPGSTYLAATLSMRALQARAADLDLVLDGRAMATGFHPRPISERHLAPLRRWANDVLGRGPSPRSTPSPARLGEHALDLMTRHFARAPRRSLHRSDLAGHARIVESARAYIYAHLKRPLAIADIARAARCSRRTLHRAFRRVLDETPVTYVRKLRLHRIRQDLASDEEVLSSVSRAGLRWGIDQPGRLAGWYKDLFGELPSDTVRARGSGARRHVAERVQARLDGREAPEPGLAQSE